MSTPRGPDTDRNAPHPARDMHGAAGDEPTAAPSGRAPVTGERLARYALTQLRYAIEVIKGIEMDTLEQQAQFTAHVQRLQRAHQVGQQRLAELSHPSARTRRRVGVRQRRGVALPPGARSVARPSRFGNPFRADPHDPDARVEAVQRFRAWLDGAHPHARGPGRAGLSGPETKTAGLHALAGYDLACYCPTDDGLPCHRDVWLELLTPAEEHTGQRR